MRIKTFRLINYKSFIDSGVIKFNPGFNVIIGQNNAGKSSLLEGLQLKFGSKPHKSLLSLPFPTTLLNPISSAEVVISASGEEVRQTLSTVSEFYMPLVTEPTNSAPAFLQDKLDKLLVESTIDFHTKTENGGFKILKFPTYGPHEIGVTEGTPIDFARFKLSSDRSKLEYTNVIRSTPGADMGLTVCSQLRERIYSFRAERLNIGSCHIGSSSILKSDASNLAEALHFLQTNNPSRFGRYNRLVNQIFPSIYKIAIRVQPGSSNIAEIMVWTEDPDSEREDLVIPLSESGTGVGQVLAILYVGINTNLSQTILIDEPNSFLHPGAARKLIEILSDEFSQHQYIISTHSPEIIKAANPSTLILIRWEKPQSRVEELDASEVGEVRKCLMEVGVKLSDIFGADQILWVEGPTEEECFPSIIQGLKLSRPGLSIVGVRNTGDLEGKHGPAIMDIYSKLSRSNALLPKTLAFIFDREDRSEKETEDMRKRLKEKLYFLPRRTYENYLIDPDALVHVMGSLATFQVRPLSRDEIVKWLSENGGSRPYVEGFSGVVSIEDETWLEKVHGAKLLAALFQNLSEGKEYYRKPLHSVQLTEWLILNKPDNFNKLGEFLSQIIDQRI